MRSSRTLFITVALIGVTFLCCCDKNDGPDDDLLTSIAYNPIPFLPNINPAFPPFEDPQDNPTTQEGIELGRFLFYDTRLSADNSMSCSSCHMQSGAFTDNRATSVGIDDIAGNRSSMSLVNLAFRPPLLFWDGRSPNLEDQALLPVEDPIELHHDWREVEEMVRMDDRYPEMFRKAFGVERISEIDRSHVTKALAQFQRSLISDNSKFDKRQAGEVIFSDEELMGFLMFFDFEEIPIEMHAECGHCHPAPLFGINEFRNNGVDASNDYFGFPDLGRGAVVGDSLENGKFRAVSLRNIALTGPYMHDGRFETLDEVIEHYLSGGHPSPNKDPLLSDLANREFTNEQKQALIAFLHTLTDEDFLNNPAFSSPF